MNGIPAKKIKSRPQNWISLINFVENRSKQKVRLPYCNLYAYAANNPIYYTDPDGRKLYICGTKEYMVAVQNELTKLCPEVQVNFYTGEVNITATSNPEKPNGYAIVSTLVKSDKSNIIWIGNSRDLYENGKLKGNRCNYYDTVIFYEKKEFFGDTSDGPMNSLISFDPENCKGGTNDTGSDFRPPFVGLAHEMGHSDDYNNGRIYPNFDFNIPGTTPKCEQNAIDIENSIRLEHKLTLRTYYFSLINSTKEQ